MMDIYIPWEGFNGASKHNGYIDVSDFRTHTLLLAAKIAEDSHPAWHNCSRGARSLHTRNVPQILGSDLDTPSEFVVCWTPNGNRSGGTGQALRIASSIGIPIFDFGCKTGMPDLEEYMKKHGLW